MSGDDRDVRFRCFISETEDPLLYYIFAGKPVGLRQKMLKRILRNTPVSAFGIKVESLPPGLRELVSRGDGATESEAPRDEATKKKEGSTPAASVLENNEPPNKTNLLEEKAEAQPEADDGLPEFLRHNRGVLDGDYSGFK